jgi:hypothetical protein
MLENDREVFTMDVGPVRTLLIAFSQGQDPSIRSEAVRLLKRARRREGLWDSRECLNIGTRCVEVDAAELLSDSPHVVRVKGYKQDAVDGTWQYVETTLRLLEKETSREDYWEEPGLDELPRKKRTRGGPRKLYIGIQLQQLPSTTGRWLLYEGSEFE